MHPRHPLLSPARVRLALVASCLVALASCSEASAPVAGVPSAAASGSAGPGGCVYPEAGAAAKPAEPPATEGVPRTGTVSYTLAMTGGDVTVTMDRSATPCTVNSFASLAEQGYFDGTRCHRLVNDGIFVLQCGDPTGTGTGGPGYSFADELSGTESYPRGVVAMANAGPGTNGSQFFLVWDDSRAVLDELPNYTVFGQMDPASVDVVKRMADEGHDGGGAEGTPNNRAEITGVTRG